MNTNEIKKMTSNELMTTLKKMRRLEVPKGCNMVSIRYGGLDYDIRKDQGNGRFLVDAIEPIGEMDEWNIHRIYLQNEEAVIEHIYGEYVEGCAGNE